MGIGQFILWRDGDRRYLLLVAVLFFMLAISILLLYGLFRVGRVEGISMMPTLYHGDRILMTRGYEQPERGDIVSYRDTTASGKQVDVIKRVVALPGDEVSVVGDVVYVNGEVSPVAPDAVIGADERELPAFVIPEGRIYLLGDNRPFSIDSRYTGSVSLDAVNGQAFAIIWPPGRARRIDGGQIAP